MLMICIINFIFAIMAMLMFRNNDPVHFGNIASAVMTIWSIETLDEWEAVLYINMLGCDEYGCESRFGPLHSHAPTPTDTLQRQIWMRGVRRSRPATVLTLARSDGGLHSFSCSWLSWVGWCCRRC